MSKKNNKNKAVSIDPEVTHLEVLKTLELQVLGQKVAEFDFNSQLMLQYIRGELS